VPFRFLPDLDQVMNFPPEAPGIVHMKPIPVGVPDAYRVVTVVEDWVDVFADPHPPRQMAVASADTYTTHRIEPCRMGSYRQAKP